MKHYLLLAAFLLASCSSGKRVEFVSVDHFNTIEISNTGLDLEVVVTLENTFAGRIWVQKAHLDLYSGTAKLAQIELQEPVVMPGKTCDKYTLKFRARASQGGLIKLAQRLNNVQGLRIEGSIVGRKGVFRKKISIVQELK